MDDEWDVRAANGTHYVIGLKRGRVRVWLGGFFFDVEYNIYRLCKRFKAASNKCGIQLLEVASPKLQIDICLQSLYESQLVYHCLCLR